MLYWICYCSDCDREFHIEVKCDSNGERIKDNKDFHCPICGTMIIQVQNISHVEEWGEEK